MEKYETVRKEHFYRGENILELALRTSQWSYVNVLVMGRVSAGKSTVLNSLLRNAIAETHLKRTTMFPTHFIPGKCNNCSDNQISNAIQQINADIASGKVELTASMLWEYINEVWIKSDIGDIFGVPASTKLIVIDYPGVCDASNEVYDNDVKRILLKYDCGFISHLVIVIDVGQGLNTVSQMAPIEIALSSAKASGRVYNIIILINKCDGLEYKEGKLVPSEQGIRDVIADIEKTVRKKFQGLNHVRLFFCPYSARNAIRARFRDPEVLEKHEIDIDSVLEYEYSRKKLEKMTEADKKEALLKLRNDPKTIKEMEDMSGFTGLADVMRQTCSGQAMADVRNSVLGVALQSWRGNFSKDTLIHFLLAMERQFDMVEKCFGSPPCDAKLGIIREVDGIIKSLDVGSKNLKQRLDLVKDNPRYKSTMRTKLREMYLFQLSSHFKQLEQVRDVSKALVLIKGASEIARLSSSDGIDVSVDMSRRTELFQKAFETRLVENSGKRPCNDVALDDMLAYLSNITGIKTSAEAVSSYLQIPIDSAFPLEYYGALKKKATDPLLKKACKFNKDRALAARAQ